MTVTKELNNRIKLINSDILVEQKEKLCYLSKQNLDLWTFTLCEPVEIPDSQKTVIIKMNYEGYTTTFTGIIRKKGEDFIIVEKPDSVKDPFLEETISVLNQIEINDEKYGQRKEKRVKVGIKNSKKFGLKKPEQTFVIEKERFSGPCAIVDASIHGLQIVTPYGSILKNLNNFNVLISFQEPNQHIIMDLHKVNIKLTKVNEKTFANISCQILEPINYIWKDRVIKMMDQE